MRRLSFLTVLLAFAAVASAQAPPTRVERAAQDDPQTGNLPPTASWRGSPIENRPYAETPEIEEATERPAPVAGAYERDLPPREYLTDGDVYPEEVDDPTDFEETPVAGATPDELRYTYGATGEVVRIDRYRLGDAEPYESLDYEYTLDGSVIERRVMPDGSRRFVREVGLDAFQASQGPGNQDYRDNRDATQAYPVENAARPTPSSPRLGTDADVPNR